MDSLTIINGDEGDDTVILDGAALFFQVDYLLPSNDIWAVQFHNGVGEIEWRNGNNESITDAVQFQPVVDKFNELKVLQELEEQAKIDEESGVAAYKARLEKAQADADEYLA